MTSNDKPVDTVGSVPLDNIQGFEVARQIGEYTWELLSGPYITQG